MSTPYTHLFRFLLSLVKIDAVKIEDILKNETDRSTWTDFKGYMNATMRSDYFDECELFILPFYLYLKASVVDITLFCLGRWKFKL